MGFEKARTHRHRVPIWPLYPGHVGLVFFWRGKKCVLGGISNSPEMSGIQLLLSTVTVHLSASYRHPVHHCPLL